MDKKINFIWLYSIVLFTAALFLILISALANMDLAPQETSGQPEIDRLRAFNQTAQQSIDIIMDQNEQYALQIEAFEAEIEGLKMMAEANDCIFRARALFNENKFSLAAEELRQVKGKELSAEAKTEFEVLESGLARRGIKID